MLGLVGRELLLADARLARDPRRARRQQALAGDAEVDAIVAEAQGLDVHLLRAESEVEDEVEVNARVQTLVEQLAYAPLEGGDRGAARDTPEEALSADLISVEPREAGLGEVVADDRAVAVEGDDPERKRVELVIRERVQAGADSGRPRGEPGQQMRRRRSWESGLLEISCLEGGPRAGASSLERRREARSLADRIQERATFDHAVSLVRHAAAARRASIARSLSPARAATSAAMANHIARRRGSSPQERACASRRERAAFVSPGAPR